MSEEMKVETAMEENFAELLEQSLKTLNNGDKVTGTVMAVGSTEIEVDLGTAHRVLFRWKTSPATPTSSPKRLSRSAIRLKQSLSHVNDGEGVVRLSRSVWKQARHGKRIEAAAENKDIVEGVVTEENKGAASSSMSRASACSFRHPSPALPRAAIWASF